MPTSLIVQQARLRSSFIYLANAVNDLSGDWALLGVILAPLILTASLCLLPDALNLQHQLAHSFQGAGGHAVMYNLHSAAFHTVQTPYRPESDPTPAPDLYPWWMTAALHFVSLLVLLLVVLVALCELARRYAGTRAPSALGEALEVYKRAIGSAPAFFLVALLQSLVLVAAALMFLIPFNLFMWLTDVGVRFTFGIVIPLLPPGLLILILLYFAQYALIFDDVHSWHALLRSRELMRGRFIKVATRIVVFLVVWWGYISWAGGAAAVASVFLDRVGVATGFVWVTIFVLNLISITVVFFTTTFFMAAGARLYYDLSASTSEKIAAVNGAVPERSAALVAP